MSVDSLPPVLIMLFMMSETDRYIRNIPDPLWRAVRVEAARRDQTLREFVIAALWLAVPLPEPEKETAE